MIQKEIQQAIKLLKKTNLSLEDRTALLTAILDKLVVLPLNDSIVIDHNKVTINGKELDMETMVNFRESAIALKDNWARKVLHEQVRYLATNLGVYKARNLEDIYFFKAALWCLSEENKLLDQIV